MRDAVAIVRGALGGEAFAYDGAAFGAELPPLLEEAHAPRWEVPVYVAATAPRMQALAGEVADGLLTPSITTPAFVSYARANLAAGAARAGRDPDALDLGCTVVASIDADDAAAGRDGAREIAAMYLANKYQNIQGAADTLLELAGIEMAELAPVAEAMERGGRLAAKAAVGDALLERCRPIAGTPAECIEAIAAYRDAGCTHVMLELWGERRLEQIRLFAEAVLPAFAA
jgi:5,10-methylenetetrahydromethanopterin reductase